MLQSKQYNYFKLATAISLILAMLVAVFVIIHGKKASFILVHNFYGDAADYFFWGFTFLGDGFVLIPILLYCFFFRKDFILPIVAGFIICTIITHILKRVIFPDELRPISLELENISLRRVLGLELNRIRSFPSGHTSTAFTMALLLVYMSRNKSWAFIMPIMAFLVGYSRVYLGQHYVTDVFAGTLVGILSAYLALLFYKGVLIRKARKTEVVTAKEKTG